MDEPVVTLTKIKRKDTNHQYQDGMGYHCSSCSHKRTIKYYYQFYAHKIDNLEEIEQFLRKYKLLKLKQDEPQPATVTKIEFIV